MSISLGFCHNYDIAKRHIKRSVQIPLQLEVQEMAWSIRSIWNWFYMDKWDLPSKHSLSSQDFEPYSHQTRKELPLTLLAARGRYRLGLRSLRKRTSKTTTNGHQGHPFQGALERSCLGSDSLPCWISCIPEIKRWVPNAIHQSESRVITKTGCRRQFLGNASLRITSYHR